MVKVTGIPQVALTVPDIEAGARFYQEKLGLELLFKTPQMAVLSCGATRVLLGTPDQSATKQSCFLYFQVADIAKAHEELAAQGVKVQGRPHMVGRFQDREVWLAIFLDPAGTLHHLISEVKATNVTPAPKS